MCGGRQARSKCGRNRTEKLWHPFSNGMTSSGLCCFIVCLRGTIYKSANTSLMVTLMAHYKSFIIWLVSELIYMFSMGKSTGFSADSGQ